MLGILLAPAAHNVPARRLEEGAALRQKLLDRARLHVVGGRPVVGELAQGERAGEQAAVAAVERVRLTNGGA